MGITNPLETLIIGVPLEFPMIIYVMKLPNSITKPP